MNVLKTSLKKILMIDHEEYGNITLKKIFDENQLKLEIILPTHDYIQMIENNHYNCVMINSDIMRNQSVDIIQKIKINFPGLMIIVLLKNPLHEIIFEFVRLGVDDFLLKPFIWNDIEKILAYYNY